MSVLLFLFAAAGLLVTPAAALKKQPLTFLTGSGSHTITVEVADNDNSRQTGLMYRRSIAPDEGMIFVWDKEQQIAMWMRNTYISLDMIFVRRNGEIANIETDTEPFSERNILSDGPVLAVIEMGAGSAARLGLKVGDRVRYPAFK